MNFIHRIYINKVFYKNLYFGFYGLNYQYAYILILFVIKYYEITLFYMNKK